MTKAVIHPGNCGFTTVVTTRMDDDDLCKIHLESPCQIICLLSEELTEVNPYMEISFQRQMPIILQMSAKHCLHTSCPVPIGILKAIEVEAGLAVPDDVLITITKEL